MSYDVSVIITTRNEEAHIRDCLESIRGQDYPADKIEVIVVDNNSTDRTKAIAAGFTDMVFDRGPERSAQRNFGIDKADGGYILYLDADMTLSPSVVGDCLRECRQGGLDALYIPEEVKGYGFWARVRNFERSFYNETCIDAVRFVRRDLALSIGGFDKTLAGPEDWDFDRRIKEVGKVSIISTVIYHNEGKFSIRKYLKKKVYYMESFEKYVQKWGRNDAVIRKQLGFFYRYLGIFTEKGNWKKFFGNIHLCMGIFVLRTLVGIAYLAKKASLIE